MLYPFRRNARATGVATVAIRRHNASWQGQRNPTLLIISNFRNLATDEVAGRCENDAKRKIRSAPQQAAASISVSNLARAHRFLLRVIPRVAHRVNLAAFDMYGSVSKLARGRQCGAVARNTRSRSFLHLGHRCVRLARMLRGSARGLNGVIRCRARTCAHNFMHARTAGARLSLRA